VIAALDELRTALFRTVLRFPRAAVFVTRREARLGLRAGAAIAGALVLSIIAPAAMLAISPAIFGVPHIAAATRYLVLRQKLSRAFLASVLIACVGLAGARIYEQCGALPAVTAARVEIALAITWGLFAVAHATWSSRAFRRGAAALLLVGLLSGLCLRHPVAARLAFVHLHNLGAVVLWIVLFRKRASFPRVTVALLAFALVVLLSGLTLPLTEAMGGMRGLGVDVAVVGAWLAPGAPAAVAAALVFAHAFTDSVHYAFWLGVVPEETLRGEGTLSFRMTLRGLVKDFGAVGLALVTLAAALVLGASLFNAAGARSVYFAVAGFHGYIEGIMLLYLGVRGRVELGRELDPRPVAMDRRRAAHASVNPALS